MRYKLINGDKLKGSVIKVPYWNAGSYEVKVNGKVISSTPWDEALGRNAPVTMRKGCGENRFVGVENFLEFYLVPDCTVYVSPRNAITGSVRLEWTLDQFYASGGVVSFVDRVSSALGIHASEMKIVAVYKGSVIIEYFLMTPEND
jgi:hypothetical protein